MSFKMIDKGIAGSLESVCKYIKADGAFILFPDEAKTIIDHIYIYCKNPDDPLRRLIKGMKVRPEEHFFDLLLQRKNVRVESKKDILPGRKCLYYDAVFRPLYILPVIIDGKVRGSLGVCGKQGITRTWNDDVVRLLVDFSDITVSAYIRKSREEQLHQMHWAEQGTESQQRAGNSIKYPRHAALIISCPDNHEPVIAEYSPGAEAVFGYEPEELIGKPLSQLYFPDFLALCRVHPDILQVQMDETESDNSRDILFRKKSGEPFPASYNIFSLSDDKGKSSYILHLTVNYEGMNKIEKALLAAEQEKTLILGSVSDYLIYMDTHMIVKWVNKPVCTHTGLGYKEITGKHCYEVWRNKAAECPDCPVREALATGKNTGREITTEDNRIWLTHAFIVKTREGSILGVVEVIQETTRLRKTEEKLRLLQFSIDHSAVATFWIDADARMVYVNEIACESLGYTQEELLSLKVYDIDPHYSEIVWPDHWRDVRRKKAFSIITDHRKKDGTVFPVEVMINHVIFEGKEYNFAFAIDLTEKRKAAEEKSKLEEQLVQARRMEALGRLAQGVAHDFNNILTGMQGYIHFIKHNLNRDNPLQHDVSEIRKSIERAAGLTEQLLAFNKKQEIAPNILDINTIIDEAQSMLLRIIGEETGLVVNRRIKYGNIRFDQHQMDQILVNLAVKVRDRMPPGGKLHIETEQIEITGNMSNSLPGIRTGEYILVRMGDSDSIPEYSIRGDDYDRISGDDISGSSAGLDLSSVCGLLHQNNCHLCVLMKKVNGLIFEIYIPLIKDPIQKNEEVIGQYRNLPRGNETILLVEDEEMVRSFTKRFLTYQGYKVLEASRSHEAIRICTSYNRKIHLLLTDVVMPELSGRELFEQVKGCLPDIKVLYMSGYSGDIIASLGIRDDDPDFLYKPFSIESLTRKIRMILDNTAGS